MNIMVLAGTSEGKRIVEALSIKGHNVFVSFATWHGSSTIDEYTNVKKIEKALDKDDIIKLIKNERISLLIDATHPYATIVTNNAMQATKATNIFYMRYERPIKNLDYEKLIYANDFIEASKIINEKEGNVILTTGSKTLEILEEHIVGFKDRCFVRILPDPKYIEKCINLGLNSKQIIAIRGPFSCELNIEIMKHVNAKVLLTKDSAEAGGIIEKIEAAKTLGIEVVIVKRPEINDGSYQNIDEMIDSIDDLAKI